MEMEVFPQFCDHCKLLGHFDLDCPVLHPKQALSFLNVANDVVPPIDDGNVDLASNLVFPLVNFCGNNVGSDDGLGANKPTLLSHPSHVSNVVAVEDDVAPIVGDLSILPYEMDREAGNVLAVASSNEPVEPLVEGVNTCLVNSLASPIASPYIVGDSVSLQHMDDEAVSPLDNLIFADPVGSHVVVNDLDDSVLDMNVEPLLNDPSISKEISRPNGIVSFVDVSIALLRLFLLRI
ncbi:hypothetical protein IEQ34_003454 [Dendrobium chrysotoxum]|uniref:Uncharacterized protein n=1 Tax=Dendrobium chrysotoxum TaxID=161865 RepID=A0AAV7HHB2_DENCH|nr:hypothetical protein IEQ34_003454 [Dendrobium chrysotoxum]